MTDAVVTALATATWLMQAGIDKCEVAGFLGISVEMLDRVDGHRRSHLNQAERSIGYRQQDVSLVVFPAMERASMRRKKTASRRRFLT